MSIISLLLNTLLIFFGINLLSAQPNTKPQTTESAAQRDTARRYDLARVSASIIHYQTNNNGRTPMQQNPMPEADRFIQQYLVGANGSLDDFADPDNIRY